MADELNRVFLWSLPRSISTAVTKSLSYIDGIQIVNQPFVTAYYYGPDREITEPNPSDRLVSKYLEVQNKVITENAYEEMLGLDHSMMSYRWIRDELLEAPYPDKKVLLCRDQATYLGGKYDMLPKGFKYSFLFRHPIKVLRSYKKYLTQVFGEFPDIRALPRILFPPGCGFKELYDLVEYVRENLDPNPTIMDADDLLQDPAGILSTYCTKMDLPYSGKILSWDAGSDITNTWIMAKSLRTSARIKNFYKHVFESVGFNTPTPIPDLLSLPEDVQACVKFSMGYYESLYRERITATS